MAFVYKAYFYLSVISAIVYGLSFVKIENKPKMKFDPKAIIKAIQDNRMKSQEDKKYDMY